MQVKGARSLKLSQPVTIGKCFVNFGLFVQVERSVWVGAKVFLLQIVSLLPAEKKEKKRASRALPHLLQYSNLHPSNK